MTFLSGVPARCCRWHSPPGCRFCGPPRGVVSHRREAPSRIFQTGAACMHGDNLISHVRLVIGPIWRSCVDYGALELSENRFARWKEVSHGWKAERKKIWRSRWKMNMINGDVPFVFALVLFSWCGNSVQRWQSRSVLYGDNNPTDLLLIN